MLIAGKAGRFSLKTYSIAPTEQTQVPMMFWGSPDFFASNALDSGCIRDNAAQPVSHDAIFHSILPLFDIESPVYKKSLDIFSQCRNVRRENLTEIPSTG